MHGQGPREQQRDTRVSEQRREVNAELRCRHWRRVLQSSWLPIATALSHPAGSPTQGAIPPFIVRSCGFGIIPQCRAHAPGRQRRQGQAINPPGLAAALALAGAACASTQGAPTRADVDTAIRARTASAGIRVDSEAPLPPDVNLGDGLTQDEAVAIALWNSPSFQATLADLGVARADLVEAGLLRNPVFSLLFPWGPKQLEFTLQYPFDLLIQRPARVDAARLNARAVGERLVWDALSLVAQVRTAHADALAADRRLTLAEENASLTRRLAEITDARLRAGDISDLEAPRPEIRCRAYRRRPPRPRARSRPGPPDARCRCSVSTRTPRRCSRDCRRPTTPRRAWWTTPA